MKIAITADCHLNSNYPERSEVLKKIFEEIKSRKINTLFILGDLFDKAQQNYSEFDALLRDFSDIEVYLIPGNHDYNVSQAHFVSPNLEVITEPKFISFNDKNFLFIPYKSGKTLDEIIAEQLYKKEERIFLLSHGDYISAYYYHPNPYEKDKIYMPLSSSTIEKFKLEKVFLGHIHKPSEYGKVLYPGSPCPVDPTETGKRSFLIFDTENFECERIFIDTPYIYFKAEILVYPVDNGLELLEKNLESLISSWDIPAENIKKVKLYLSFTGYFHNKSKLKQKVEEFFNNRNIEIKELNLDDVLVPDQDESFENRKRLFEMVINKSKIPEKVDEIRLYEDEIKQEILKIIFCKK
jgi:DNA repair exonuclease SbcCD nuclease subunit